MDEIMIERQLRKARREHGAADRTEAVRVALERMGHEVDEATVARAVALRADEVAAIESIATGIQNAAKNKISQMLAARRASGSKR